MSTLAAVMIIMVKISGYNSMGFSIESVHFTTMAECEAARPQIEKQVESVSSDINKSVSSACYFTGEAPTP